MYVYGLYSPLTGEIRYVGKTVNLEARLNQHRYNSKSYKTHLYCWWRTLGVEPVMGVLSRYDSEEAAFEGEKAWIKQLREVGAKLVNHTDGGEGASGFVYSMAALEKRSKVRRGEKRSEETKIKMSEAQKGHFVSDETKKKISEKLVGLRVSDETRKKLSAASIGHKRNLGKIRSEEVKAQISRKQGGRPFMDQFGNLYQTVRGACKKLDLDRGGVRRVLQGKQRSYSGFIFKYLEESQS